MANRILEIKNDTIPKTFNYFATKKQVSDIDKSITDKKDGSPDLYHELSDFLSLNNDKISMHAQKSQDNISKLEISKQKGLLTLEQIKKKMTVYKNNESFRKLSEDSDASNNNINIIFETKNSIVDSKNTKTSIFWNLFSIFSNKSIEDAVNDNNVDIVELQVNEEKNMIKSVVDKKKSVLKKITASLLFNRNDKSSAAIKLTEINKTGPIDEIPPPPHKTNLMNEHNDKKQFSFVTIASPPAVEINSTAASVAKSLSELDNLDVSTRALLNNTDSEKKNEPHRNTNFHEETQYTNLIREILHSGYVESGRNGDTLTKFGYSMRYTLRNGTIPILTTKKLAWRVCFEELFWFIRGCTSNKELQQKNVHIWDQNSNREFLDSRGLYYLEEGDLGPIYGFQWRHFNAEYSDSSKCYQGDGIDQLQEIIDTLQNPETRNSRRMIMTAWNPCQLNYMALPPCHILAQFHVRENRYLSCALYQRSGDVGLGIPFNIASYSLLTHILAKHCGLEADEFVHFLGNCHIYKEHVDALSEQIKRQPFTFPKIEITKKYETIDEYHLEDISWTSPYQSHPPIKMEMKA
jgi:thymidylate synthase